jgi:hypothetical protein
LLLEQIVNQYQKKGIFTGIIEAGVFEGGTKMGAGEGSNAAVGLLSV